MNSRLFVEVPWTPRGVCRIQFVCSWMFDFVSALGDYAELLRLRDGQEAVPNLHKAKYPTLSMIQSLKVQGSTTRLGDDGLARHLTV
jgi:hypothetical protein